MFLISPKTTASQFLWRIATAAGKILINIFWSTLFCLRIGAGISFQTPAALLWKLAFLSCSSHQMVVTCGILWNAPSLALVSLVFASLWSPNDSVKPFHWNVTRTCHNRLRWRQNTGWMGRDISKRSSFLAFWRVSW